MNFLFDFCQKHVCNKQNLFNTNGNEVVSEHGSALGNKQIILMAFDGLTFYSMIGLAVVLWKIMKIIDERKNNI